MVLRGSNITPEQSLEDAVKSLNEAKAKFEAAQEDILRHQEETVSTLLGDDSAAAAADGTVSASSSGGAAPSSTISYDELVEMTNQLRSRVMELEEKEYAAAKDYAERQAGIVRTLRQLACGGAAGAVARTVVAPIDRVKILMQTSFLMEGGEGKYKSLGGTFRHIVSTEGATGLWRGNLTNCIRVVPHTAVQFVSYEKFKPLFVTEGQGMSVPNRLMAGALSGMTAATFTHPMDVVRIRLQTQPELKGMMDAVRSVYAENGMRTFYKGYTPAMLSLSPFIAINFATFDTLKTWYYGDVKMTKKELQSRNPGVILGLGAFAGIFAQTCCYPLDTVRRRMQLKGITYTSTPNAFATIAKVEGIKGFYKGMAANALKVVPNNAIRFASYEVLKSFFATADDPAKTEAKARTFTARRKTIRQGA